MSKGTPSKGKMRGRVVHIRCRRCGEHAYHVRKKSCSHCGFGATTKLRTYGWQNKIRLGAAKK